jgi:hypothetical protein
MNSSTGVWQAPADTDPETPAKITATNGTFTATLDVFVLPLFPLDDPVLPINRTRKRSALISMSEDRTSRIVREKAAPYDSYRVRYLQRDLEESNEVDDFWDVQGYGSPFILEDLNRGIRKIGWFDSEIEHEDGDAFDLSFLFEEWGL